MRLLRLWWRRLRPADESVTITIPPFTTAAEALAHHERLVDLVMKYDLDMETPRGADITLWGRPRRVAAFRWEFGCLRNLGEL